eukprot:CAMPEP_0116556932 /NCGR_PEP_ID=MMETSP0397-20121206/8966_1 /TAXON_ID=216820 /ORGANISM="Cyclophora tenuis, Strain ECT3854" /LENGTH=332 /DNA_ID=CAMNT_0004082347 /DNA_START=14 /DNA_END=1012 /DNA_ORIENTATION=-
MASLCMPCRVVSGTDLSGLVRYEKDAGRLSQEIIDLSTKNQESGKSLVDFATTIKENLSKIGDGMKPAAFMSIMELLKPENMNTTITTARDMGDVAEECVNKSLDLSDTVQKSVDCFPSDLQQMADEEEAAQPTPRGVGEEMDLDFETEIADLEHCTASLRGMHLFAAAKDGTHAFDSLTNKSDFVYTMMDRIKELCTKVAQITQSLMVNDCCAQIQAGMASLKELKRCAHLSGLINTFAQGGKRLVNAIRDLVDVAKTTFGGFLDQFNAAKKIQHFAQGIGQIFQNPLGAITNRDLPQQQQLQQQAPDNTSTNNNTGDDAAIQPNSVICCT